jgi:5-methylthioadenosine/S-adenosylhomocysteine deaminase
MLLKSRYVLPVASPHIEHGAVLVRGDRIVAVGSAADLIAANPAEEVVDLGLAVLMPGFVDLHTHLEYSVFRGLVDDVPYTRWKMQVVEKQKKLDKADWEDSAVLGAMEALQSGITTVADITKSGSSARAAAAAGLGGVIYREVSTMDKTRIAEKLDAARADLAEWRAIAGDGMPAAIHLAGSRDEYDFVKYGSSQLAQDFRQQAGWSDVAWMPTGVSPVRYVLQWGLFDVPQLLAVHCVQVDDADVEILASRGVGVAHCPRCNAKLGMGIAPLKLFFKHGLTVGLGTDSPASNNTLDFFDEMRIGLLLQRGVSDEQDFYRFFTARTFVRLATIHGAKALGLDAEIGSLEAGKRADLVAVDLSASHMVPTDDPYSALVHTANQESVVMTMVAGRVLYDRGDYLSIDSERALARAEEIQAKLRG